ncbi:MAG: arsenosugar biosynthesis radical SAM protein ArsS [Nitrospirae bacterium]|nr:arsenosugar biosynthesis radical SAM protein ArsS [Nitrospirota bacterium]
MPKKFETRVEETLGAPLSAVDLLSLQVNMGYRCNMSCRHCHVSAGPGRMEIMGEETVEQVLFALKRYAVRTLDITGGAPELNPHFSYLVAEAKKAGCHIVARTNLTVFFEKGYEHLPWFYRDNDIEITASFPLYFDAGVDGVRGEGTFVKSIRALQLLNGLGYGDGRRRLNLVYNPPGAQLAPSQEGLEEQYRRLLGGYHRIFFDRLYVSLNMPIGRFKAHLEETGSSEKYLKALEESFNPLTLGGLMCRRLISVGWDGALYDCDFNQVLGLHLPGRYPQRIADFDLDRLSGRRIRVSEHCYGCAAGQGST